MNFLERFDFSSYKTMAATIIVLWVIIGIGADGLTTVFTAMNLPEVYAEKMHVVRMHTWLVSSLLAFPVLAGFLVFIRHIELLRKDLKQIIRRDDLTGILSREAFLEDLRSELAQESQDEVSDAFLIVDADFFKKINDNHGHIAGDRALVAITNALKKGIRASDRIGRLGGEEFAIHLKHVDKKTAQEIAERLRKNVMASSHEAEIPDLQLSVSIGAVFYNTKQDVVSLLTAADRQLYKAKDNGRNRVEFELRDSIARAA
ncbi:MAG: GGDEF domain-containing protein [Pseudomonadota bacterium]